MAESYRGLTIRIGGDATKLDKALKSVNSASAQTGAELRKLNTALRLDPDNVEAFNLQIGYTAQQASNTANRLHQLKAAQEQLKDMQVKVGVGLDESGNMYAVKKSISEVVEEARKMDGLLDGEVLNVGQKLGTARAEFNRLRDSLAEAHTEVTDLFSSVGEIEKTKLVDAFNLAGGLTTIEEVREHFEKLPNGLDRSAESVERMVNDVKALQAALSASFEDGFDPDKFSEALATFNELHEGVGLTSKAMTALESMFSKLGDSYDELKKKAAEASGVEVGELEELRKKREQIAADEKANQERIRAAIEETNKAAAESIGSIEQEGQDDDARMKWLTAAKKAEDEIRAAREAASAETVESIRDEIAALEEKRTAMRQVADEEDESGSSGQQMTLDAYAEQVNRLEEIKQLDDDIADANRRLQDAESQQAAAAAKVGEEKLELARRLAEVDSPDGELAELAERRAERERQVAEIRETSAKRVAELEQEAARSTEQAKAETERIDESLRSATVSAAEMRSLFADAFDGLDDKIGSLATQVFKRSADGIVDTDTIRSMLEDVAPDLELGSDLIDAFVRDMERLARQFAQADTDVKKWIPVAEMQDLIVEITKGEAQLTSFSKVLSSMTVPSDTVRDMAELTARAAVLGEAYRELVSAGGALGRAFEADPTDMRAMEAAMNSFSAAQMTAVAHARVLEQELSKYDDEAVKKASAGVDALANDLFEASKAAEQADVHLARVEGSLSDVIQKRKELESGRGVSTTDDSVSEQYKQNQEDVVALLGRERELRQKLTEAREAAREANEALDFSKRVSEVAKLNQEIGLSRSKVLEAADAFVKLSNESFVSGMLGDTDAIAARIGEAFGDADTIGAELEGALGGVDGVIKRLGASFSTVSDKASAFATATERVPGNAEMAEGHARALAEALNVGTRYVNTMSAASEELGRNMDVESVRELVDAYGSVEAAVGATSDAARVLDERTAEARDALTQAVSGSEFDDVRESILDVNVAMDKLASTDVTESIREQREEYLRLAQEREEALSIAGIATAAQRMGEYDQSIAKAATAMERLRAEGDKIATKNILAGADDGIADMKAALASLDAKVRVEMPDTSAIGESMREYVDSVKSADEALKDVNERIARLREATAVDPNNMQAAADLTEALAERTTIAAERANALRQAMSAYDTAGISAAAGDAGSLTMELNEAKAAAERAKDALADTKDELDEAKSRVASLADEVKNADSAEAAEAARDSLREAQAELAKTEGKVENLTEAWERSKSAYQDKLASTELRSMADAAHVAAQGMADFYAKTLSAEDSVSALASSSLTGTFGEMPQRMESLDASIQHTVDQIGLIDEALKQTPLNVDLLAERQGKVKEAMALSARQAEVLRDGMASMDTKRIDELAAKYGSVANAEAEVRAELLKTTGALNTMNDELQQYAAAHGKDPQWVQGVRDGSVAIDELEPEVQNLIAKLRELSEVEVGQRLEYSAAVVGKEFEELSVKAETASNRLQESLKSPNTPQLDLAAYEQMFERISDVAIDAGRKVIESANEMDTAYRNMRKTVDGTETEFEALRQSAIEFSQTHITGAAELLDMEALGGQLGIATQSLEAFGTSVSNIFNATDLEAEDAALKLGQMTNVMSDLDESTFDNFADALVRLGNNTATTESAIMNVAQRMSSVANVTAMTTPELLAWSAAIASTGQRSESAATAITNTITGISAAISEGGSTLQQFATIAGMSADEFKNKWETSSSEALEAFVKGLSTLTDDSTAAISALDSVGISSVRQETAILSLTQTIDNLDNSMYHAQEGFAGSGDAALEAQKKAEGFSGQLAMLQHNADNLGAVVGDTLVPVISALSGLLATATEAFQAMPPAAQMVLVEVGGAAAGFGALNAAMNALGIKNVSERFAEFAAKVRETKKGILEAAAAEQAANAASNSTTAAKGAATAATETLNTAQAGATASAGSMAAAEEGAAAANTQVATSSSSAAAASTQLATSEAGAATSAAGMAASTEVASTAVANLTANAGGASTAVTGLGAAETAAATQAAGMAASAGGAGAATSGLAAATGSATAAVTGLGAAETAAGAEAATMAASAGGAAAATSGLATSSGAATTAATTLATAEANVAAGTAAAGAAAGGATTAASGLATAHALGATAASTFSAALGAIPWAAAIAAGLFAINTIVGAITEWQEHQDLLRASTTELSEAVRSAGDSYGEYADKVRSAGMSVQEIRDSTNEALRSVAALADNVADMQDGLDENAAVADYYADRLKELGNKGSITEGNLQVLRDAVEEYNAATGSAIEITDEATGALSLNADQIDDVTEAYENQARRRAYLDLIEETIKKQIENKKALDEAKASLKEMGDTQVDTAKITGNYNNAISAADAERLRATQALKDKVSELSDVDKGLADDISYLEGEMQGLDGSYDSVEAALSAAGIATEEFSGLTNEQKARLLEVQNALVAAGHSLSDYGSLTQAQLAAIASAWDGSIGSVKEALAGLASTSPAAVSAPTEVATTAFKRQQEDAYESFKQGLDDSYDALKDSLDAEYKSLQKALDAEYKLVKKEYDRQYNERKKQLDKEYKARKEQLDKEYDKLKDHYDDVEDAAKDSNDDLLQQMKDRHAAEEDALKKQLDKQYNAYKKSVDKQYKAYQKVNDRQLKDYKDQMKDEVDAFEEATDARIELIKKEYEAKKQSVEDNDGTSEIEARIAELEGLTKAEQEAIKAQQQAEKKAELEKALAEAKTRKTREEAQKALSDYLAELAQEAREKEREAEIASLEEKKKLIEEETDARQDALDEERDARIAAYEEQRDTEKAALEERQDLLYDTLKEKLDEQEELRKEKDQEALDAYKEGLDSQLEAMKERHRLEEEEYAKQLDGQLQALKDADAAKLQQVKDSHDAELEALKEHHTNILDAMKEQQSNELEAIKDGQSAQLEALKESHNATLEQQKRDNDARLREMKRQQEDELKAFKDGGAATAAAAEENAQKAVDATSKSMTAGLKRTNDGMRQITDSTKLGLQEYLNQTLGLVPTEVQKMTGDATRYLGFGLGDMNELAGTKATTLVEVINKRLHGLPAEAQTVGESTVTSLAESLGNGQPIVETSAGLFTQPIKDKANETAMAVTGTFEQMAPNAALSMTNGITQVSEASNLMFGAVETRAGQANETLRAHATLTGTKVGEGLTEGSEPATTAAATLTDNVANTIGAIPSLARSRTANTGSETAAGISETSSQATSAAASTRDKAVARIGQIPAMAKNATSKTGAKVAEGIGATSSQAVNKTADLRNRVRNEASRIPGEVRDATVPTGQHMASGIKSGQGEVSGASNLLRDLAVGGVSNIDVSGQGAEVSGSFNSGIESNAGNVEGTAGRMAEGVRQNLAAPTRDTGTLGSQVGNEYASGIAGQANNAASQARGVANSATNEFGTTTSWARNSGESLGNNFASGIASMWDTVVNAARSLADAAADFLHHSVPKKGPLRDDDKWGAHLVENFVDGMRAREGMLSSQSQALAGLIRDGAQTELDADMIQGLIDDMRSKEDALAEQVRRMNDIVEDGFDPQLSVDAAIDAVDRIRGARSKANREMAEMIAASYSPDSVAPGNQTVNINVTLSDVSIRSDADVTRLAEKLGDMIRRSTTARIGL